MKLETFFEKFDQFVDAPDAVAKMRELVMDFATTGALGLNSEADEPASVLLERITGNLEELVRDKIIRKPKSTEPLPSADELKPIPTNWVWTRLGNAVDYGSAPKVDSSEIAESEWLLDLEDIEKSTSRLIRKKPFGENPSKSSKAKFDRADVLYGKLRPYLDKVLVADEAGYCTTEIIPIRTYGFVEPDYLRVALKRPSFIQYAVQKSYGMNLPRLGTEDARNSLLPLPPLAEQKRIVAKVDELMALCDRLEAQQQERDTRASGLARASLARFADAPTPANLNFLFHSTYHIPPADLRKSILTLAFNGCLTSAGNGKNKIPKGWEIHDIASLCIIEDGDRGKAYPKKADFKDNGYCIFLNAKNVTKDGFNFSTCDWIDKEKHEELRKGTLIPGDVVFTSRGTLGNIAHFNDSVPYETMRINSGMFILRGFQEHMHADFLTLLLRSPLIRDQIESLRSGSAQPQLPIREFRKFKALIPPLAEQRRIVAKVDQLMALVDELETQLTVSRATAKSLFEALVAELTTAGASPPMHLSSP